MLSARNSIERKLDAGRLWMHASKPHWNIEYLLSVLHVTKVKMTLMT
jgi:Uri superfamily endonuclease